MRIERDDVEDLLAGKYFEEVVFHYLYDSEHFGSGSGSYLPNSVTVLHFH